MKLTNTTAIIFFSGLLLFCACSNSSGNKANVSDANTSSPTPTGAGGRFSYTVNGERVETASNVQNANLYINEVSNDAANKRVRIKVTCAKSNVFDLIIANSGSTTIDNHQRPSFGVAANRKAVYMDGKTLKSFYAVSVTVTITSLDNSRISGTFSGTFKANESDGGAMANITSGSFDLPFVNP